MLRSPNHHTSSNNGKKNDTGASDANTRGPRTNGDKNNKKKLSSHSHLAERPLSPNDINLELKKSGSGGNVNYVDESDSNAAARLGLSPSYGTLNQQNNAAFEDI